MHRNQYCPQTARLSFMYLIHHTCFQHKKCSVALSDFIRHIQNIWLILCSDICVCVLCNSFTWACFILFYYFSPGMRCRDTDTVVLVWLFTTLARKASARILQTLSIWSRWNTQENTLEKSSFFQDALTLTSSNWCSILTEAHTKLLIVSNIV